METADRAQNPYEIYCYHCRVSFPPEARHCIHCGERLGRPVQMIHALEAESLTLPRDVAADDAEESGSLTLRRFGGLGIWALIALSALFSNLCRGGG